METLQGKLLIAGGNLFDPNFRQTVILIADHDDEGALGVVLNRPAPVAVADAAPPLAAIVPNGESIFLGGPVRPDAAVVVADFEHPDFADRIVSGSIGVLTEMHEVGEWPGIKRARVFAGHAGWGPGQLETELAEDSWIVAEAEPGDVFTGDPKALWTNVLRRKGETFRLLSSMPFDPTSN